MKFSIVFFVFLFSSVLSAQKTTEIFSSKKLNEDREITIGLPKSYGSDADKRYPILLLLDGDYLFDPFYGVTSYTGYWDDLPEIIVVGISQGKNEARSKDSFVNATSGLPDETGASFYDFIGMELLPYLDKKYKTAPFRIIAGHDTTAGYLNFFLYKDQPLFNAYIVMSPDLALNMDERIPLRLNAVQQPLFYYLATADDDVKKLQTSIKQLDQNIKAINKPTLNYRFTEFKGTHYSLVPQVIPDALYSIFEYYQPITIAEYQEKIAVLEGNYVDYLVKKYDIIEKTLGMKIPIRINDFKAIEAAIIKNKAYLEFEKLAILSKKSYPKSMLSDYHMAQFYEHTGDKRKATKTYLSALSKTEIGDLTKDMMYDRAEEIRNRTDK